MKQPGIAFVDKKMSALAPMIDQLAGSVFDFGTLSVFCSKVSKTCQRKALTQEQSWALSQSVSDLEGQILTKAQVKANANRIVANWNFVQEGVPIPYWDGTKTRSDAVFIGFQRKREVVRDAVWYSLRLKLKTGIPAGIIVGTRLSRRQLSIFLDRVSGTGRFHCGIEEVAGMAANVSVERDGDQIRIGAWECSPEQRKANVELAELRGDVRRCANTVPCNICRKTIKDCNLAVWLPEE